MPWVGVWVVLSPKLFVLNAEFLQDLLVADLAAGNVGEIIEGELAEGNVLSGKSTPDIAQLAVILGGLLWVHDAVLSTFSNLRQNCYFFPLAVVWMILQPPFTL